LDSIAQAAGRCNRSGKLEAGFLRVFVPEDAAYPRGVYEQAAGLTAALLNGAGGLSIDDPTGFDRYFRDLYSITSLENRDLNEALRTRHFPNVRKHYRIIEQDSVNALVAYDRERYEKLAAEVRADGLSRDWVRRARPYAVSCYRDEAKVMEPVPLKDRTLSGDWFLYDRSYNAATGLQVPKELEFLGI
jgi:CRISPR-associated endonuclease/helicase Cas3